MDGDPATSDINAELDERWMARCARKYEWLRHNMDVMVDALRCVWNLNVSYGINLHFDADFGACKVTGLLCTKASGFAHSDITLHRTVKSLESEAVGKLADAERSLSELRNLLAMKDGGA